MPENLLLVWAAELAPRAAEMRCAGTGATAQDEGTFGEWLDELPIESPSRAPRAGRDRDHGPHSSPNCLSDVPEPSDCSD